MKKFVMLLIIALPYTFGIADDVTGQTNSAACSACHGVNGISVNDKIPNLAGQKITYLTNQLKAFRDGKRSNALMSAVAGQLSDEDIDGLAAHFNGLQFAAESVTGEVTDNLDMTHMSFPDGFLDTFSKYQTVNRSDINQVRYLYANEVAIKGANGDEPLLHGSELIMEVHKAKLDDNGEPIVGDDGYYIPDVAVGYGYMEKNAGYGDKVPEILKNSDWNYTFFTAEKKQREGINQADCLACHKPLDTAAQDYMFEAAALREFAAR